MKRRIMYGIGAVLQRSSSFRLIAEQMNIMPGRDIATEVKRHSWILWFLLACRNIYIINRRSSESNAARQLTYWNTVGKEHHTSKDLDNFYATSFQKTFYKYIDGAVGRAASISAIEVGAGSFYHAIFLMKNYPTQIERIIAIDISDESERLYSTNVREHWPQIEFIKGSILDNLEIMDSISLVVSHSVLLYLNQDEMEQLLLSAERSNQIENIIIEEPRTTTGEYWSQGLQHFHDYGELFKDHGFKIADQISEPSKGSPDGRFENAIYWFSRVAGEV